MGGHGKTTLFIYFHDHTSPAFSSFQGSPKGRCKGKLDHAHLLIRLLLLFFFLALTPKCFQVKIESAVTIFQKGEAVSDGIISTVNSFAPTVRYFYFDAERKKKVTSK